MLVLKEHPMTILAILLALAMGSLIASGWQWVIVL
jgi:hypothetical protein